MTRSARIAAWWFAPAPAERLATLRIVIGGAALVWRGAAARALRGRAPAGGAVRADRRVARFVVPLPPS